MAVVRRMSVEDEGTTMESKTMNHDDIIKEVRTIREQLAVQHAYDVRALFASAKERQQESERKVVKLVPKSVEAPLTSP